MKDNTSILRTYMTEVQHLCTRTSMLLKGHRTLASLGIPKNQSRQTLQCPSKHIQLSNLVVPIHKSYIWCKGSKTVAWCFPHIELETQMGERGFRVCNSSIQPVSMNYNL